MTSLARTISTEIVSLSGHISASNASQVQSQLHQSLTAASPIRLVLDMSQVEFLDSAGLMVLVNTLSTAQKNDSELALCCLPSAVKIILELTQLTRAFTILESVPSDSKVKTKQLAIAA